MRLYKRSISVAWNLFGLNRHFFYVMAVVFVFFVIALVNRITLFLDHVFFPEFRKKEVKNPVFIIGHPRSGTTFVHQLFTQTGEMAAFKAWHVLFPALTARVVLKPLIRFLTRRNLSTLIPGETGHEIAIDNVEEDELLFLQNHDTQFTVIVTPLGFVDEDFRELRYHDLQPRSQRVGSVLMLKSLFQRQIYHTGQHQVFAQTHFSTHRIKTLLEVFPDAKFIYMHRLPHETLPSYFSLNHNVLDHIWGLHRFTQKQITGNFKRQYRASLDLYRYFYDLWKNHEIGPDKVLIVDYKRLRSDLMNVFDEIVAFTGIQSSNALIAAVKNQADIQKQYKRKHEVSDLSKFGLDEKSIKKDFNFIYQSDPFGMNSR